MISISISKSLTKNLGILNLSVLVFKCKKKNSALEVNFQQGLGENFLLGLLALLNLLLKSTA